MTAKELLDAGRLGDAIAALTQEVRARPLDSRARTALFEALCYSGDWDRAARQLDALGGPDADPKLQAGVQVYHDLIEAERKRSELFAIGVRPRFMLAPPPEVLARLDAIQALREGRIDEAQRAMERGASHHVAVPGDLDGLAFDDIRDADDLLAPVLEVFTRTGYFWVPWGQIQYLEVNPPSTLRELLWLPAKLASRDGQLGEVFLPTLYPSTATCPDDAIRLGRGTDWVEEAGGAIVRGVGRKILLVGDEDRTLPDVRVLRLLGGAGDEPSDSGAGTTSLGT